MSSIHGFGAHLFGLLIRNLFENRQAHTCDVILRGHNENNNNELAVSRHTNWGYHIFKQPGIIRAVASLISLNSNNTYQAPRLGILATLELECTKMHR